MRGSPCKLASTSGCPPRLAVSLGLARPPHTLLAACVRQGVYHVVDVLGQNEQMRRLPREPLNENPHAVFERIRLNLPLSPLAAGRVYGGAA